MTMAIIFKIGGFGDKTKGIINSRKRILEGQVYQQSYIPIQVLRHNLINQMGQDYKEIGNDKTVLQDAPEARIDKYPEIDLFGYVNREEEKIRLSTVRLSNAISLEDVKENEAKEIYYVYTISMDLDRVGKDENDNIEIENKEKASRVINLLNTIKCLYIDINGKKKTLEPLFVIGGVYNFYDAIFHDNLGIENNRININKIKNTLNKVAYKNIKENTYCGLAKEVFDNESDIVGELGAVSVLECFEVIKERVMDYYKGNTEVLS